LTDLDSEQFLQRHESEDDDDGNDDDGNDDDGDDELQFVMYK
jgi:hypothetical protein